MSFRRLQFPPKNEGKQINLRYHSSKIEFVSSFFGGIKDTIICFRDSLTFRIECGVTNQSSSIIDFQWFPLCIKINAVCLVMHYANWLIESQVWELLFNLAFQLIIELESSTEREKKSVANCHTDAT